MLGRKFIPSASINIVAVGMIYFSRIEANHGNTITNSSSFINNLLGKVHGKHGRGSTESHGLDQGWFPWCYRHDEYNILLLLFNSKI